MASRHKTTLSIILKRELADCSPSREVPVLHIARPTLLGGDVEIELGASVHPVRMLPVSGKDVRNLRFGLVYGPKRKRVRFRAPDPATYDNWEMILEVAVEKAAAERPTFPVWPGQGPSPSLSADDGGYISEEFGFTSDYDDELRAPHSNVADFRCQGKPHNPMTGSFLDFVDPVSPNTSIDDEPEPRLDSLENEYDARFASFHYAMRSQQQLSEQKQLQQSASNAEAARDKHRFRLQLLSAHSSHAKVVVGDYVSRLRSAIIRIHRREELAARIKRSD